MEGKVWLVGAGPGDEGLLTLKARSVLMEADVIVYDHLVGKNIIIKYGAGKELRDVGKTAGHHSIVQEQIHQILAEEAEQGKKVVRLKGGDPFLFGRGGEEAEALAKKGIPFEIVPGVSSALAVPAYNGIPVTHREYASSLHIVTGHVKKGAEKPIPYKALVEAGGTLVFLMGVTALESIMEGLLKAGMDPEAPAAVLQEGTTAGQRRVLAPADTIAEKARAAGIRPPALLVAGDVCRLSEKLGWYEKLPLMGLRILLTRPRELMDETAEKLRKKGAEVLEVPMIDTVPLEDDGVIQENLEKLSIYDWIVFTSQIGVHTFFKEMKRYGKDIRELSHIRFAVIGESTGRALRQYGIFADVMPEVYDGSSLGSALAECGIKGKRILIPRAEKGSRELAPILDKAGASVCDLPLYRTVYCQTSEISVKDEIEKGRIDYVVFTSSSTVEGLVRAAGSMDFSRIKAVCIGRQTAETAGKYGMQCYISNKALIDSIVELIERMNRIDDEKTQKTERQ